MRSGSELLLAGFVTKVFGPLEQVHALSAVESADSPSPHIDPEVRSDPPVDVVAESL